jgi:hypothetical protein
MPRRESEEEDDAPLPPGFTTQVKAIRNDEACHADPDAEGTEADSDPDVEKQFDESTGKKLKYNPYLQYTEVMRWSTGPDSLLEQAQIDHEIYTLMK